MVHIQEPHKQKNKNRRFTITSHAIPTFIGQKNVAVICKIVPAGIYSCYMNCYVGVEYYSLGKRSRAVLSHIILFLGYDYPKNRIMWGAEAEVQRRTFLIFLGKFHCQ